MLEVCRRWGLPAAVVGEVTADGDVVVVDDGMQLARVPAPALASDSPETATPAPQPPQRRRAAPAPGETPLAHDGLPERGMDPGAVLEALLGHPNLGSRAWVTTQYDQTVGADTIDGCERGAAVLRVKGTARALVVATDSQPMVGLHDPGAGRRAGGRGVRAQRGRDRRAPAGHHQLPQLRRPRRCPRRTGSSSESVRGLARRHAR